MKRPSAPVVLALVALLALAVRPALAAMEIAVSVSPAEGVVGRPVEVLLRTFAPFGQGSLGLPVPSVPYPAPSGFWNVLYPFPDYPFDVVAEAEDRTTVAVTVTRDPTDATLWRGTFTPPKAGAWTIWVRNFRVGAVSAPGSSARLQVATGEAIPLIALVGVAGLLTGALVGLAVGLRRSRQRS